MTFLLKFVQKIPINFELVLQIYGVPYKISVADCQPDKWCERSLEIQNIASCDFYVIILVFDKINELQIVRIGYFGVKIL